VKVNEWGPPLPRFGGEGRGEGAFRADLPDTGRLDADPLAAGLEAIAVGYSLRYPDDLENIENQFEV
jgi:hypothetical protein